MSSTAVSVPLLKTGLSSVINGLNAGRDNSRSGVLGATWSVSLAGRAGEVEAVRSDQAPRNERIAPAPGTWSGVTGGLLPPLPARGAGVEPVVDEPPVDGLPVDELPPDADSFCFDAFSAASAASANRLH